MDIDVAKFFDSVRWDLVVKAVEARTNAPWVLLYVKRWLQAPPRETLVERDYAAIAATVRPLGVDARVLTDG